MASTDTKTWLVTGAGRGTGARFARAALTGSHNAVADLAHDDVGAAA
jgi:hypothetical protein